MVTVSSRIYFDIADLNQLQELAINGKSKKIRNIASEKVNRPTRQCKTAANIGFYVGLVIVTSANCKTKLWFGLDKQLSTLVLKFNFIFSISSGCGQKEY
jgi:hypothetical protein